MLHTFCPCLYKSTRRAVGLPKVLTIAPAFIVVKVTVKILKIGTPEIFTITVLQLEQLDFTVQYCVQKMQTE